MAAKVDALMAYVSETTLERLLRELAQLRADQAAQFGALRADLARLRARSAAPDQVERIEAVAGAMGAAREFTAPELLAAALLNTPAGARLAEHFAGCTVRMAGVRIGRMAGQVTPAGRLIERSGQLGDLVLWRVTDKPTPAGR